MIIISLCRLISIKTNALCKEYICNKFQTVVHRIFCSNAIPYIVMYNNTGNRKV